MILKFFVFLIWANGAFCCDQLIGKQLDLLRQPRHSVVVNILLTIYQDPLRSSYNGQVSEYLDGLQSNKLWEESCQPGDNNQSMVLNGSTLTLLKGEEVHTFAIHCDGDFIIGVGKGEKVIGTFQYEYNIH